MYSSSICKRTFFADRCHGTRLKLSGKEQVLELEHSENGFSFVPVKDCGAKCQGPTCLDILFLNGKYSIDIF